MADVFAEMRTDHERLQELLDELRGDPAGPVPEPGVAEEIATRLVMLASKHEALEELVFWPAVRARAPGGRELAAEGLDQEATGKKLLNELAKTSAGTEEFRTLVLQVASAIRRHVIYEETRVWPRAMSVLSGVDAEAMGGRLRAGRALAPTRPHPLTPADPRVLATVGPIAGALDRLRDGLTGRGRS